MAMTADQELDLQKRVLNLEEQKKVLEKQLSEGANKSEVFAQLKEITDKLGALQARLDAAEKAGKRGPGKNDPDLEAADDDGPTFL